MLNDKDTQDLIKYLTLMTERFSETVGPENFHRMASLEMRAYDVALRALTTPIFAGDVSEEDLDKALNESIDPHMSYIPADDGRNSFCYKLTPANPTQRQSECSHAWEYCHFKGRYICLNCDARSTQMGIIKVRSI